MDASESVKGSMSTVRGNVEKELTKLKEQRDRYRLAADATDDRDLAARRLLAIKRLDEEIEARELALAALDDRTIPITIGAENRAG